MIQKDVIRQVILDYREIIQDSILYQRKIKSEENANMVLMGIRRGGKSSVLYLHIKALISDGATWDQIAYINFEDERLLELALSDFDSIYGVLQGSSKKQKILFLEGFWSSEIILTAYP